MNLKTEILIRSNMVMLKRQFIVDKDWTLLSNPSFSPNPQQHHKCYSNPHLVQIQHEISARKQYFKSPSYKESTEYDHHLATKHEMITSNKRVQLVQVELKMQNLDIPRFRGRQFDPFIFFQHDISTIPDTLLHVSKCPRCNEDSEHVLRRPLVLAEGGTRFDLNM